MPESLGGMNFPVESSFPYAASALLSCAVWRERGVSLDVLSLVEATNAVRCGVDNLSLPPTDDISLWTPTRLKGVSGRFAQRWHMDRAAGLVSMLLANKTPQNYVFLSRWIEGMSKLSGAWMGVMPNRIRAPLSNAVVVCGLRARMMYSTFSNASAKANCGCGAMLGREESLSKEVVVGTGVRFGPPGYEEAAAEDSLPEGKARELVASRKALALAARDAVAIQAANSRLRSDGSHALRCLFAAAVRTDRHNSFCKNLQVGFQRIGKVCQLECLTGSGEKREDLTIPELGVHLDVVVGALDEVGDNNYPALDLGGGGRVETAPHEKAFVAWLAAAQRVAFGTLTRLAAEKRTHHAPAVVTPLAVSAGGGMFSEDDDRLPCGADRNGRHWLRVELSSTLLKYRTALTWQLWKRRPNGVFVQAT